MSGPGFVRLDDGTFHHVVAVHSDEIYTLYVDGATLGAWRHHGGPATIEFRGNELFTSYERPLTEDEIEAHRRAAQGEDET